MRVSFLVRRPPVVEGEHARPVPNAFAGLVPMDEVAQEDIRHRAYAIWQREGRPDNRTLAHWLEAEADVRRRRATGAWGQPHRAAQPGPADGG
ncbi:MAG TPA: DUF2934 domain-containing protein [Opitutaceae bacterium]|nr:DUF2934 domain-containing protein [Opitutaceae bacterium]